MMATHKGFVSLFRGDARISYLYLPVRFNKLKIINDLINLNFITLTL